MPRKLGEVAGIGALFRKRTSYQSRNPGATRHARCRRPGPRGHRPSRCSTWPARGCCSPRAGRRLGGSPARPPGRRTRRRLPAPPLASESPPDAARARPGEGGGARLGGGRGGAGREGSRQSGVDKGRARARPYARPAGGGGPGGGAGTRGIWSLGASRSVSRSGRLPPEGHRPPGSRPRSVGFGARGLRSGDALPTLRQRQEAPSPLPGVNPAGGRVPPLGRSGTVRAPSAASAPGAGTPRGAAPAAPSSPALLPGPRGSGPARPRTRRSSRIPGPAARPPLAQERRW